MTIAGHKPSGENGYETPQDIFEHWNRIFNFDLDVCALAATAKIKNFISPEQDTFKTPWAKKNWMNPPYGKPERPCSIDCKRKTCKDRGYHVDKYIPGIPDFVKRAFEESKLGKLVVALLPVSPSTDWWQTYVKAADHVFLYPHRINFLRGRVIVKGVSFDPCIVIWGLHP